MIRQGSGRDRSRSISAFSRLDKAGSITRERDDASVHLLNAEPGQPRTMAAAANGRRASDRSDSKWSASPREVIPHITKLCRKHHKRKNWDFKAHQLWRTSARTSFLAAPATVRYPGRRSFWGSMLDFDGRGRRSGQQRSKPPTACLHSNRQDNCHSTFQFIQICTEGRSCFVMERCCAITGDDRPEGTIGSAIIHLCRRTAMEFVVLTQE